MDNMDDDTVIQLVPNSLNRRVNHHIQEYKLKIMDKKTFEEMCRCTHESRKVVSSSTQTENRLNGLPIQKDVEIQLSPITTNSGTQTAFFNPLLI